MAKKPLQRDWPYLVEPAPASHEQLAALGADLVGIGAASLELARRLDSRHILPAEFRAAMDDLAAALEACADGAAIVGAIARLVHYSEPPPKFFGATLHGLSIGLRLWSEQTRLAASNSRKRKKDPPEIVERYRALHAEGLNHKEVDARLRAEVGVGLRWAQELAKKMTN
jgi:hypothetical protein